MASISKEDIKPLLIVAGVAAAIMIVLILIATTIFGGGDESTTATPETTSRESSSTGINQNNNSGTMGSGDSTITTQTSTTPTTTNTNPPLPGEKRAVEVNPDGETVYQRFQGNHNEYSGMNLWGDTFSIPVKRTDMEGPPYEVEFIPLNDRSGSDPTLDAKAVETIKNIYSFRVQNYANMTCALSGYDSISVDNNLKRRLKDICKNESQPITGWEQLMELDAYSRVFSLRDVVEGYVPKHADTDTSGERMYYMSIGFVDAQGNTISEPTDMIVYQSWKKTGAGWVLNNIDTRPA